MKCANPSALPAGDHIYAADGTVTATAPSGSGAVKGAYHYDLMGRLTLQMDYVGDGSAYAGSGYNYFYNVPATAIANYRAVTYDTAGRVTNETDIFRQGADSIQTDTVNSYGTGSGYALGALVSSSANSYKNATFQATQLTAIGYVWYDSAVQAQVDLTPDSYHTPGTSYHTYYSYTASGGLASASVQDGRPRSVTVTSDALGQAIRRDEADGNASGGDPHELWYRFNGRQLGYVGNNGSMDVDYASSLAARTQAAPVGTPGAFRGGASYGMAWADFDWYKLAEANGITGDAALVAGRSTRNGPDA